MCDDDPLHHGHGLAPPLPVPGVHLEVHWLGRVKAGEKEPGLGPRHVPHQAAAVRQPDLGKDIDAEVNMISNVLF